MAVPTRMALTAMPTLTFRLACAKSSAIAAPMETPTAIEIPMMRFMFGLFAPELNLCFLRRRLLAAVAVPDAAYQGDCDVGCDSYAYPDGDVAGGGAKSRAHGGSQGDGQAE